MFIQGCWKYISTQEHQTYIEIEYDNVLFRVEFHVLHALVSEI